MSYWLMKSEPEAYSIDDLARERVGRWDGVRNYQARNFMKAMKVGDLAFFYHSSTKPSAIVGVMRVVKEAYPDPTQFDPKNHHYDPASSRENPRWALVDVEFVEKFSKPLSLDEIKGIPALEKMVLLKRGRLSVQPVTTKEWSVILKKAR